MIRLTSGGVLSVGVVVLLSQVALAQMAPQDGETGRPVVFSAEVRVESTDNRDSREANKESNVDVYLSPRIDVVNHGTRLWLDLYYMPHFRYRSSAGDTQNDNELQHDLGLMLKYGVSDRLRLKASERFDMTDDPAVENGGVRVRGDQSYLRNYVTAGVNYDVLQSANLDVVGTHRMKRYDEQAVADISDEDEISVEATVRRQMSEVMRLMAYAQYSTFGYQSVDRLSRDFDATVVAGGLEYLLSETCLASILAGWQTRSYDDAQLGNEGMPYAKVSVTTFGGRTQCGADILHGVRDSDAYPFASQEFTDIRGRISCELTAKVNVRGAATYRLSSYNEEQTPSGTIATDFVKARSGDETTTVIDVGVGYAVTESMSLSVGQRYENVDSDVGETFTKNTTHAAFGVTF